ncbi:MAG: sodium:proton antiporter [Spirochaetes bacterium]|nr:sodium:proton antiporter [Spirochaetota bacterium]
MPFVQNFPFFSIYFAILCGIFTLPLGRHAAKWLSIGCHAVLAVLSGFVLAHTLGLEESFVYMMGKFPAPFGNELRVGVLEAFMALLFSTVGLLSIAGGSRDIFKDVPQAKINLHYVMQNMLSAAMLAVIYTNDIFTAYVFIEIIVITACSIVSTKLTGRNLMATMSYLLMSLIGSGMMLLGIGMLYGVTGHLLFPGIQENVALIVATENYKLPLFVLSALFVAGLAIKSALFPFHGWLPDAHASATTSASAVLSGLIVKAYIILLVKLAYNIYGLETMALLFIPHVLMFFALAGIVYGSVKAIRQKNVKLMLSYASISSIGFIYAGISLNTDAGIAAACFHIVAHAVAKAMLFTAAGGLAAVSGGHKDYGSLLGAARRDPFSGAVFIIGAVAMIGIPPFSGFASKLYLATAAMQTPYFIVVIPVAIVLSTFLGIMYYFPVIYSILSKRGEGVPSGEGADAGGELKVLPQPFLYRASLAVFAALTLYIGLFSQQVLSVIERGLAVLG